MAKTNLTSTQFAAKKLLGKAQTSNKFTEAQEAYPSNVSVISDGVFAEPIPREPGTSFNTVYSASVSDPATVERVYFDLVAINDSIYDANDSDGGGEEAQPSGPHAYYMKLPSDYTSVSDNSKAGTGVFTNGKTIYSSKGGLQIVPPFATDAGLPGVSGNNYYGLKLYKGDPSNPANEISETDATDWLVDYYSGIVFVQDYDSTKVPVTASAYLYVGKYLNEKIEDISTGVGANITIKDEGSDLTTSVSSIDFVGSGVTVTNSGDDVTVNVSAIAYQRTNVTTTITASISDKILGINATNNLEVRLPSASDYAGGQYFTIKDEGGNAGTYSITILPSGSQTIDGAGSISLLSPYSAVNLYSNGVDKFFIY